MGSCCSSSYSEDIAFIRYMVERKEWSCEDCTKQLEGGTELVFPAEVPVAWAAAVLEEGRATPFPLSCIPQRSAPHCWRRLRSGRGRCRQTPQGVHRGQQGWAGRARCSWFHPCLRPRGAQASGLGSLAYPYLGEWRERTTSSAKTEVIRNILIPSHLAALKYQSHPGSAFGLAQQE